MDQWSIGRRPDIGGLRRRVILASDPEDANNKNNVYGQIRTTFKQNKL